MASDTSLLLEGIPSIPACLVTLDKAVCGRISFFALLQQLPALLGYAFAFRSGQVSAGLSLLNLACVFAMAAGGFLGLKQKLPTAALIWLLVLVASPFLLYSSLPYSEPFAALFVLGFVLAVLAKKPIFVLLCAFLASISKETAPVFLLFLLAPALAARQDRDNKKTAISASAGILLGIMTNGGFNWLRYGTWTNATYSQPHLRVQSLGQAADFFLGSWLSPSAGLLFEWPAFVAALAITGYAGGWRERSYRLQVAALLFFCCALSLWYAPYGWLGWGNRLLLPWLPALAYLLLYTQAERIKQVVHRLSRAIVITSGVILGVLALPQLLALFDERWVLDTFRPSPICPTTPALVGDAYYYACMDIYLWRADPTYLRILQNLAQQPILWGPALGFLLLFAVGFSLVSVPKMPKR